MVWFESSLKGPKVVALRGFAACDLARGLSGAMARTYIVRTATLSLAMASSINATSPLFY